MFQQLYNTADSLIVGNFLGSEALAAVSSSGNLIFLMVGLVNGISMGAGVVIARYFGAKDYDRMQKTIHTLLAFGLVAGALLTIVGIVLSPVMLRLMDTPETVLPNSISYFAHISPVRWPLCSTTSAWAFCRRSATAATRCNI